jgi:hypothetical protein
MKHGSTILKYGSDASVAEVDDITILSKTRKYKRLFAFFITLFIWSTHCRELDMV